MSDTKIPRNGTEHDAPPAPPADPTAEVAFKDIQNGTTGPVLQKWADEHNAAINKWNKGVTENNPSEPKGYKNSKG
jgi:hypothetical protein